MRLIFVPFIFIAGLIWSLYEWQIKKNAKIAKDILAPTVFFGLIWALIFYWILK